MHAFRRVVEAREFGRLEEVFAENVVLHSPIARRPYEGREMVVKIVTAVASIFGASLFNERLAPSAMMWHKISRFSPALRLWWICHVPRRHLTEGTTRCRC
jgi:hypothetical protein